MKFKRLFLMLTVVLSFSPPALAQKAEMVQLVYFYPKDHLIAPSPDGYVIKKKEITTELNRLVSEVRKFYLREVGATFDFKKVEFYAGKFPRAGYLDNNGKISKQKIIKEIDKDPRFDLSKDIYLIATNMNIDTCGTGRSYEHDWPLIQLGKRFNSAVKAWAIFQLPQTPACSPFDSRFLIAHELGHTFGLDHDYRTGDNIMSYNFKPLEEQTLSPCAVEWLKVCRAFNFRHPARLRLPEATVPIGISDPDYSQKATGLHISFELSNIFGEIHTAQLHVLPTPASVPDGYFPELAQKDRNYSWRNPKTDRLMLFHCRPVPPLNLLGKTTIDFVYTKINDVPITHIQLHVIDKQGNLVTKSFGLPDLVVESSSASKTILAPGERFRLDTTVRNQGAAASKPTILRFYRSSDANISPEDTELQATSVNRINVGRQVRPWKRFTAPNVPGTYYYGVCVDVQGEGDVGNNCSKAIQITVGQTNLPDLVIKSISVSKTILAPGERFRLDTTVRNQGAAASKPTILRFYRSSDANISPEDTELQATSVNRINVGRQVRPWKRFTAPNVPGTYYYGVCVDSVQGEGDVGNNCSKAIAIIVSPPDTIGQNQAPEAIGTISPVTLTSNSTPSRVNVSNYFRDSDGDNLSYTARSNDTNVVRVRVSGAEVTITPQNAGSAIIQVTASDGTLSASQRISVTVTATQTPDVPDLVVESTRVSKNRVASGGRFTFYATVRNQGTDPAAKTTLRYYRSVDSTISKNDTEEDSDSIRQSLNPDQTSEEWNGLRAPNTPGTYYYGACVDSVPNEINTNNNCSNAIAITVYAPGPPDLIVENPRVDKNTLDPGESFTFYATVRNQGTGDADTTTLYYNRSNDPNISENDTNERWDSVSSLYPDETGDEWATLTAPDTPGTYYYGACVDSVDGESNINNNCSTAVRVTVGTSGKSDLVVDSARVSETTLEPGESFKFYATVLNQGTENADSTTLRYYFSDDSDVSNRDTEDDTDRVTSLDPDETDDEWATLTVPDTPGTYYYAAYVESVSNESNTNNNWSQVFTITVGNPGLQVWDPIVVQNANGGGLNGLIVRKEAGTGFKHVISVFNGATGIIVDGPTENDGYTWWEVRWNHSDQVFCDVNPCVGWVFEFFEGTRVIAKDDALAAPLLDTVIPTETVLLSNYPNPFNPETWIPYQLAEASDVKVSIHAVDGRLIRTLALGHQPAGLYQRKSRAAYWNGRNEFGELVASGLYFYTLTAGDFTVTRKMLIQK